MKLIHSREINVTAEHLDVLNHVNNVQFVHWVEEIAREHWDLLKHRTDFADDYWILADHYIQYKKEVFEGEILTVRTYPQPPEGIRQPRKVEFYRGKELVADSRTLWILIDSESKKIKKVDSNWLETMK